MSKIFCLARSVEKSKPGETPSTQMRVNACFAGYIITLLSLLFDPSPHEICFGPPPVKLFFKPEPPLQEHSGG